MKIVLGVILLFYVIIVILFYYFQDFFIFHPRKTAADFQYHFPTNFKEHVYSTPNNGSIHSLQFKAEHSKGVVLYLHGNAGNLQDWGWLYKDFVERDYDALIIDYRNYGKSKGKLSHANMLSDVQFVYNTLKEDYGEDNIVVYGRSIGTGMATYLAGHNKPHKLILESPYYNLNDLVKRIAPFLPTTLLVKYPFTSNEWIQDVTCPIYILHGEKDQVVSFKSGYKLYESVKDKANFYQVDEGNHNDLSRYPEYFEMLEKALP